MPVPGDTTGAEQRRSAPVRVFTVDDNAGFRAAAREVVAATPGFEPVGDAAAGPEALDAVGRLHPSVVLVDVRMPGMSGMEVARRISTAHPDIVVLLVSSEKFEDAPAAARSCGARAFVRKEKLGPGVLRGLWSVHGGGRRRLRGPQ